VPARPGRIFGHASIVGLTALALPTALLGQTPVRADSTRTVVGLDSLHIAVTRELGGIESSAAAVTRVDASTIRDGRLTIGLDE
jgi:hypothetical protein